MCLIVLLLLACSETNDGFVSLIETRLSSTLQARVTNQETEAMEVLASVERRFKDVSSGLSLAACAKRAHFDVATSLQSEIMDQMTTQFVGMIIDAVGNVIMYIFAMIAAVLLMQKMGGPMGETISALFMKAVEPYIITEIAPVVEERMAVNLLVGLNEALTNRITSVVIRALVFHVPRAMGKEIPPRLLNYSVRVQAPIIAKQVSHNIIHAITHKVIRTMSQVMVESSATQVTSQLSHQLVNYFYCVYCYQKGEFCRDCQTYNQYRAADSGVR